MIVRTIGITYETSISAPNIPNAMPKVIANSVPCIFVSMPIPGDIRPLKDVIYAFEEDYILKAIASCGGNVAEASNRLGMHKSGIYKKLDEYKKSIRS